MSKTKVRKVKVIILEMENVTTTHMYTESKVIVVKLLKKGCQKHKKIIVLDDEMHCPVDTESIYALKYCTCVNVNVVPAKYKYKEKEKITEKYLIWYTLPEDGRISKLFITTKS